MLSTLRQVTASTFFYLDRMLFESGLQSNCILKLLIAFPIKLSILLPIVLIWAILDLPQYICSLYCSSKPPDKPEYVRLSSEDPISLESRTITVGTFNIHDGIGKDGKQDFQRIFSTIESLDCDVIGLQELWSGPEDERINTFHQQFEHMAFVRTGKSYFTHGHQCNIILSKHPIRKTLEIPLPSFICRESRFCIGAEIEVHGEIFWFICVHFQNDFTGEEQRHSLLHLFEKVLPEFTKMVVLAGDFNLPQFGLPGCPLPSILRKYNFNNLTQSVTTFSFCGGLVKCALDHIILKIPPHLKHAETFVDEECIASDHQPIRAALKII